MKEKLLLNKNKKLLILFVSLLIMLTIIIFVGYIVHSIIMTDTHSLFKENWNIDIPNPQKIDSLLSEGGIDYTSFEKMYYSEENIDELKKKEFFKKIENNSDEFNRIYKILTTEFLVGDYKWIFENYLTDDIVLNKNNYYALFERNKIYEPGYCFTFLILDTENNNMYSIIWTS